MINPAQTFMLVQALQKVKESDSKVGSDHRDLHSSVSKIGKSIDRSFVADYDSTSRDDVFSSPDQQALLNKVILQHFCRQGLLDISDVLIREANFPIEEDPRLSKAAFQQLNEIQEAFQRRDIGPALEWAISHRYVHFAYTQYVFIRNGLIRNSSEIFRIFKEQLLKILEIRNKFFY